MANNKQELKIGIVGGTGLDNPDILQHRNELADTQIPFGPPSDSLIAGDINGVQCVLLARHGRKHDIYPTAINFRANVHALARLGVTHVIATTACGSLQEEIKPGESFVILDQFIDRTTKRTSTFYDGSCPEFYKGICHFPMAEPFCSKTRECMIEAVTLLGLPCIKKGTVVTVEGPRFSTKAESHMFKSWNCDVINMTTVPEVCLCREAGLSYASLALPTDYDCWKESEESVTVDMVFERMKQNSDKAIKIILKTIDIMSKLDWADTIRKNRELVKSSIF